MDLLILQIINTDERLWDQLFIGMPKELRELYYHESLRLLTGVILLSTYLSEWKPGQDMDAMVDKLADQITGLSTERPTDA